MTATARTTASPWRLLAQTAGSPSELGTKLRRLAVSVRRYADAAELDRRLGLLVERGYLAADAVPTRLQLAVGAIDMLRFWISPAAAQYYASKGIHYGFHQVLRVLDDPASMVDPTGLMSDQDVIIGHLMQVVHANPCYDLQLLEAHSDGLTELERQVRAMLDGSHPRAASIGAIVEEADYHARLLDYVVSYRADPVAAAAPVRDNVSADPKWAPIERTFGTLPSTLRYFASMPRTLPQAIEHLRRVNEFPAELGEPAPGSAC
ncbi:MAG: hypothetical protein RIF41_20075 [Polyangiaceae bacterium]